jgi:hypothetical protein
LVSMGIIFREAGVNCLIIPANTVFWPGNEKKIKTDRQDAILIAWMGKRRVSTYRAGRKNR